MLLKAYHFVFKFMLFFSIFWLQNVYRVLWLDESMLQVLAIFLFMFMGVDFKIENNRALDRSPEDNCF